MSMLAVHLSSQIEKDLNILIFASALYLKVYRNSIVVYKINVYL
jgi:hypothetical protein